MTSPAIKLAEECGFRYDNGEWQFGGDDAVELFYAKAQAQALRDAAETLRCDFRDFDAATLYRMAADLERKS